MGAIISLKTITRRFGTSNNATKFKLYNYELGLLVVFLDVPALVIPRRHLNFGPRRMFPKMFLAKLRIQKLFLQLKKETKVAPPEDPSTFKLDEAGSRSSGGSRSCSSSYRRRKSSSRRRRPKLLLYRIQKLFLQPRRRPKLLLPR